ncbi:hypothetical protein [Synechococcus sp. MIT S9503]|uniref:hypothetical protein n=1 Tax=Synechococcus sp. MIT S9503 TaxID=3082547 RepID=UPI0039A64F60
MTIRSVALSLAIFGSPLAVPMAHALEPEAVDSKFQNVIILTPVDETGELMLIKDVGMVAFFSRLAADQFAKGWQKRTGNSGEFRVAPLSLTRFESAFLTAQEKDQNLAKAYVPDPAQIPAVIGLQMQQGVEIQSARTLAQSQPYIFCPDPLIRVKITPNDGGTPTTRVPCGFSFTSMALIINQINQNAKSPTVLKAYSLQDMVAFLSKQSGEDAKNMVIATPIEITNMN